MNLVEKTKNSLYELGRYLFIFSICLLIAPVVFQLKNDLERKKYVKVDKKIYDYVKKSTLIGILIMTIILIIGGFYYGYI